MMLRSANLARRMRRTKSYQQNIDLVLGFGYEILVFRADRCLQGYVIPIPLQFILG
jgi:hypothetical protein